MGRFFGFTTDTTDAGMICKTDEGKIAHVVRVERTRLPGNRIAECVVVQLPDEDGLRFYPRSRVRGNFSAPARRIERDPLWLPWVMFGGLMVALVVVMGAAFIVDIYFRGFFDFSFCKGFLCKGSL